MILSRTAHAMYWLNRYLERAENQTRLMEAQFGSNVEGGGSASLSQEELTQVLSITGDLLLYQELGLGAQQAELLAFTIYRQDAPNSLFSSIIKARDNAQQIREVLSTDMWETVNSMYWSLMRGSHPTSDLPFDLFQDIRCSYNRYLGLLEANLYRDELWQLARLGQMIERADHMSRMLYAYFLRYPTETEYSAFALRLLRSCDALDMYRRAHQTIEHRTVLDFIAKSPLLPRSLAYCLCTAMEAMVQLMERLGAELRSESLSALRRVGHRVQNWNFHWTTSEADCIREELDAVQRNLNDFDARLFQEFFDLKVVSMDLSMSLFEPVGVWGAAQ